MTGRVIASGGHESVVPVDQYGQSVSIPISVHIGVCVCSVKCDDFKYSKQTTYIRIPGKLYCITELDVATVLWPKLAWFTFLTTLAVDVGTKLLQRYRT